MAEHVKGQEGREQNLEEKNINTGNRGRTQDSNFNPVGQPNTSPGKSEREIEEQRSERLNDRKSSGAESTPTTGG